jgi:hypothetical protein
LTAVNIAFMPSLDQRSPRGDALETA